MKKRLLFFLSLILSGIIALIVYGTLVEPRQIAVRHIPIHNEYFGKILSDRVVVHISDLHLNDIGQREKKVLALLRELNPDFIFLTGDYIKWNGNYEAAIEFFSLLNAKVGTWAVMGDYDYSNSRKSCLFCHDKGSGNFTKLHSVRFLRDRAEEITLPAGSLLIAGVEYKKDENFLKDGKLDGLNGQMPAIILSHSPLSFDLLDRNQELIVLAGDTHGGQVPLPSWLTELFGYEKNSRYNYGLYESGRKKMFVSLGVGTSHVPVRLFRQPEIVVYHFEK